jgi:hypothetical protein
MILYTVTVHFHRVGPKTYESFDREVIRAIRRTAIECGYSCSGIQTLVEA